MKYNFIIIGGGIIGLSTAWQLTKRHRNKKVLLLEKENSLARHQTGHNSGVIHAGVYYEPGSLRARFCREGAAATFEFCRQFKIPCRRIGKLLVATDRDELRRMNSLFERCCASGLSPELLSPSQLRELEPEIRGSGAFLVRESGIIDGSVTVSPNAVQGWKREGYGKFNFSVRDTMETLNFPGFWKFSRHHWRSGLREYRNSFAKRGYLKQIRKYCPGIGLRDLEPYPAGIRAQAVLRDGTLIHDFLFKETARSLHVCNAPSPAATSAIPIGKYICERLQESTCDP